MQSNLSFRLMAWEFQIRDRFHPPDHILETAGIQPGMNVLDFGSGPGSFSIAAARLAGETGHVYALDIHPMALAAIQRTINRQNITNIEAIHGARIGQINDASVDLVLLYDTLHDLEEPEDALLQIYRVLKPGGILSIKDHSLTEEKVKTIVTARDRFKFMACKGKLWLFTRSKGQGVHI